VTERTAVPILLYHAVTDDPSDFIAPYTVSPATFRRHLDAVAATGATTLTVSDFLAARAGGTLPERPVLVTFDDGYRDTLTAAAPALAERGMVATTYVTTGVGMGTSPGGNPMVTGADRDWPRGPRDRGAQPHTFPARHDPAARGAATRSRTARLRTAPVSRSRARLPHGYRTPGCAGSFAAGFRRRAASERAQPPHDRPYTSPASWLCPAPPTRTRRLARGPRRAGRADRRAAVTVGWRWYRRARARVGTGQASRPDGRTA
jgi:hypothetical protein